MTTTYSLSQLGKPFISAVDNTDDSYTKYITNKFVQTRNNGLQIDGFLRPTAMLKTIARIEGSNGLENKLVESNFGLLKKAVVKISRESEMIVNDYKNSLKLAELKCSNFIKYYGLFTCKDSIKNYNKNKILPEKFCKQNGYDNYFLFMPYFPLGSLVKFVPENVEILISIINQIIGSLVLAFEKFNFIHNDLHPGNVLVRKTKRETITYKFNNGDCTVKTHGFEIVFFDFDRSTFDANFINLSLQFNSFFNVYNLMLSNKNMIKKQDPLKNILRELQKITNLNEFKYFICG